MWISYLFSGAFTPKDDTTAAAFQGAGKVKGRGQKEPGEGEGSTEEDRVRGGDSREDEDASLTSTFLKAQQ